MILLLTININMLAEELNDIPKEGKTFYMESMLSSHSKKNSRASSKPYEITSIVSKCFDEENIGEYAWLMTADGETRLSVELSFTENDDRYKIVSQEISFYFYDGSDLFHDDNKELITETDRIVGKYTSNFTKKTVTVDLTAPKVFPYENVPYYTFYMVIKLKFANGGTASVAKNLGVSRTGVLMLHGLNDSYMCFQPLKEYLVWTGNFISSQLHTKDYSATNTSSFYANTYVNQVVKIGLFELSNNLFEVGIASSKYDMIGHSMGGILERLYNQEIDNEHTNKLITVNTPHFGAPLGNVYSSINTGLLILDKLLENAPLVMQPYRLAANGLRECLNSTLNTFWSKDDASKAAINDLAYGSSAINSMGYSASRLTDIPVYSVGTYLDKDAYATVEYSSDEGIFEEYAYLIAHLFQKDIPRNLNSYLDNIMGEKSDAVVSVNSQRGGLTDAYCSIFNGTWGDAQSGGAFHSFSPKWAMVKNKLYLLLLAEPNTSNFCLTGYNANANSKSNANRNTRVAEVESTYIDALNVPNANSYIHINMEEVENENYTHKATITHSDDMATTVVFSVLSKDRMISDYDKGEMKFDLSEWEGEYTFYAIGRTDYDALVIDSVVVKVTKSTGIENTYSDAPDFNYSIDGNNLTLEGINDAYSIKVWDVTGRMIMFQKNNALHRYTLPVSNGLYIVELLTTKGRHSFKIWIAPNSI